jgi:hypothetical protein
MADNPAKRLARFAAEAEAMLKDAELASANESALAAKRAMLAGIGGRTFSRHRRKTGRTLYVRYVVKRRSADVVTATTWNVPPGTYLKEKGAKAHTIRTTWGTRARRRRPLPHSGFRAEPFFDRGAAASDVQANRIVETRHVTAMQRAYQRS